MGPRADSHPATVALSVVVPTLNEGQVLPALLARLLRGSHAEDLADQVIVSDGGSSDETCALARQARVTVVQGPPGRGEQLARGAQAAGVEGSGLLLFLHADSMPGPGALTAVRRAFRRPGPVAAGMRQTIAAQGAFYRLVERAASRRVRSGLVFGDSGLVVRRSAYRAVGGFRDLPLFEDVDLSRRLARLGPVLLLEDAALSVSPRRWRREGALLCTLRNVMLRGLYGLGVPSDRLAMLYPTHRPTEERP